MEVKVEQRMFLLENVGQIDCINEMWFTITVLLCMLIMMRFVTWLVTAAAASAGCELIELDFAFSRLS